MDDDRRTIAISLEAKRDGLLKELARLDDLMAGMRQRTTEIQKALQDCQSAARVFDIDIAMPTRAIPTGSGHLKNWVVEVLRQAGERGVKSGPLREQYEAMSGKHIHPKTIGMTLYRVKEQGMAVRRGRVWFAAPICGDAPE